MTEIMFLARHTPFWGIPLLILGAEFGYLFWLKKKKASASICLTIALFGLLSTGFYVWVGGPNKAVKFIRQTYQELR
jgi:NADPH-dependent ferric siderophore reductase